MGPAEPHPPQVYAITPDWRDSQHLLQVTRSLLEGGLRWLQYRDKSSDPARRAAEAQALRRLTRSHGAHLIINDDVALAQACGADGVHLGEEDVSVSVARAALGPQALIGLSCYNDLGRVAVGVAEGADYVALGAVHASPTKPAARRVSLITLAEAVTCGLPVCAIGGMTPDNVAPVIQTGVRLVAVVSALYEAASPLEALQAFDQALMRASPTRT